MSKSWKLTSQELELTVLSRFACDLVVHSSIARKDDLNSPSLKIDLVFKTENISVSRWRKWRLPLLWRWQHRVSHKDAAYNETTMTFVKKLHWNRRNSFRILTKIQLHNLYKRSAEKNRPASNNIKKFWVGIFTRQG